MRSRTVSSVSNLFSIPVSESAPIEGLPQSCFSIEKRGALVEYAELLASTCSTTGQELAKNKAPDLGSVIRPIITNQSPSSSSIVFTSLSESVSGFDDRVEVVSDSGAALVLPFYKNARRLLHDLPPALTAACPLCFAVPAPSILTVSALVQLGILATAGAGGEGGVRSESLADDVAIRCAAVVACHRVAELLQLVGGKEGEGAVAADAAAHVSAYGVSLYLERLRVGPLLFTPKDVNMKW